MSTLGACWKLSRRNRKTPDDDRKSVADASRPETVRLFYNIMFTRFFVIGCYVFFTYVCKYEVRILIKSMYVLLICTVIYIFFILHYVVIIIPGLHHYECVAPLATSNYVVV